MHVRMYWVGWKAGYTMTDARDLWIVQLDDLIKHALQIRDTNVMDYSGNAKKAFSMGLNLLVLLMKKMIEEMVEDKADE